MKPPSPQAPRLILETPRLVLREWTLADLDFLAATLGDAEVMRWFPAVLDRAGAEAWMARILARYAKDGHAHWLTIDKATGTPVGQVGLLTQRIADVPETEVAYMIHRPHWRKGYALEAARAVRDHALVVLQKPRVISLVRPENAASRAVAEKLGMKVENEVLHHGLTHLFYVT